MRHHRIVGRLMLQRPMLSAPDVVQRRARGLSETDRAAWAAYARSVVPLDDRAMPPLPESPDVPPPVETQRIRAPAPLPQPRAMPSGLSVGEQPGGLDNSSWNRLRSGKVVPARTLDLHGRTVQRAYHALHAFLHSAHADQVRCVEVITGKGSGENGGAIRREFPIWLNLPQLRPLVLAASYPHAANQGSVRLLLRRPK
jgi:DNA-nicking Smr family endonuclease